MNNGGFEIVLEWSYDDALSNGLDLELRLAEEALGPLLYALNQNPLAFSEAFNGVRVAKLAERPIDGLPPFRVFFAVNEANRVVYLRHVDHG